MSQYSDRNPDGIIRNKYPPLPKISDLQATTDIIPYRRSGSEQRNNSGNDMYERVTDLETRLSITEKSNRALLEEVVRLHGEFKSTTKYYEEAFREERKIRSFIENQWKSGQGHIRDLESRLQGAEELINQERYKIRDLANLSKNVEDQIYSSKKDATILNERHLSKISTLEREVENLYQERQKVEKISLQLVDEMKMIKSKLESQGYDFSAITSELRNKSRKLEDEYQMKLENAKRQTSGSLANDSGYRNLVEQRISEMRDNLNKVRNWYDDEVSERRNLEKSVMTRISDLTSSLADQLHNSEEAVRQLQYQIREKEHKAETDKLAMQNKLVEISENINSKVLEKDLKLREEQLKRQSELEKLLRSEQETRISYEREIRLENEKRLDALRQLQSEELNGIKENMKNDKSKYVESVKRLDEAVSLIERQNDETKNEMTRIIAAEVKSRTAKEKLLGDRIIELEEKISAATSSLQITLSGLLNQTAPNNERIRKMVSDILDDYKRGLNTQMADLDARLLQLQGLSVGDIANIDEKINDAISKKNSNLKDKIDSISLWQGTVNATLSEIKIGKQQLKQEIYELTETLNLTKSELKIKIEAEIESRIRELTGIREDMDRLKEMIPKDTVTKEDVEKLKMTSRKLGESIQTIKTILGMKIQSEQKLRVEEIKNLQEDISNLRTLIEPFIHARSLPRIFVKSDEDVDQTREEKEISATPINHWSLYNANKWLQWKTKWMYVKWLASNRNKSRADDEVPPPPEPNHPWEDDNKDNEPPKDDKKDDKPPEDDKTDDKPPEDDKKDDKPPEDDKNDDKPPEDDKPPPNN